MNSTILANIDDVMVSYNVRDSNDFGQKWSPIAQQMWQDITSYDAHGAQYGEKQLAPHLSRISDDGATFLLYLGYPENVVANFNDAYRLSDIGKIDKRYNPEIWSLPHRPTDEERILKRKHTEWAPDVIQTYTNGNEIVQNHPHVNHVIPALSLYHHERLDSKGPFGLPAGNMGVVMQVACIVDAYDGDRIQRPHQPAQRTPKEALDRMGAKGADSKYDGAFDADLLDAYRQFKLKQS